ncbi:MAG: DUF3105 domain-containing protein [Chloroflexota bacterium]|nr:DUF3105 domain-containing protein [Chloroflexota bacterium]
MAQNSNVTETEPELPVHTPIQVTPAVGEAIVAPVGRSRTDRLGLLISGGLLLAGLLLGALLLLNPTGGGLGNAACDVCGTVQEYPDQGHTHIAVGEAHPTYVSDPPVSGWHREEFPRDGQAVDMLTPLPDEVAVHLLEHGYLVAWYRCPAGPDCTAIRKQLDTVGAAVPADARFHLYVMDRSTPAVSAPTWPPGAHIALTAWQHVLYLPKFDAAQVNAFVQKFGAAVQENMAAPTATP